MPRDGNGNYALPAGYEGVTGQAILPEQHNPPLEDIAVALTGSLPVNGSKAMTGDLPMGGKKITGLGTPTNAGDAATKAYVDGATSFDPSVYVTKTGDQDISGLKTFATIPRGPATDPTNAVEFTRKAYVDAQIATRAAEADVVKKTTDQTIAGVKTFGSIPLLPASDPTTANQAARKSYVDARMPVPTGGAAADFGIGSLVFAYINVDGPIANGATIDGTKLRRAVGKVVIQPNGEDLIQKFGIEPGSGALTGTWKNVSGETLATWSETSAGTYGGYWVRTV